MADRGMGFGQSTQPFVDGLGFVGARFQGSIGLVTEPPTNSVVESSQFGPNLSLRFDQGRGRYIWRRCCRILESLATFCYPLPQAPLNSRCRQGTPAKRTTALDLALIRHPRAPHGLFLIYVSAVKESDFSEIVFLLLLIHPTLSFRIGYSLQTPKNGS